MSGFTCPECGDHLYRSHSRGFREKLVKAATRYRPYRCHECGWRGWLTKEPPKAGTKWLRRISQVFLVLFVIIFVTALVIYLTSR